MLFFELIAVYLVIGLCVGAAFALLGAGRCAQDGAHVSAPARMLLIPGAMIFWPLVIARWRGAGRS